MTQNPQNFQECAHLEIEDHFSTSKNTLDDLLTMQKNIQEQVYGYNFEQVRETLGSLKAFCDFNYHADQDEWREFFNALGGIHSHGSAVWKPWKSKHKEALEKKFVDLTPEELKELQMEVVDRWHFLFNISIAVGLDAKTLFNYYVAKNKHNIERQQRPGGY